MSEEVWKNKHYSYFSNTECEYFPCHPEADKNNFNCLFCFCPLYVLGESCGGNYKIIDNNIKDCTNCTYPHDRKNYGAIMDRYNEIAKLIK